MTGWIAKVWIAYFKVFIDKELKTNELSFRMNDALKWAPARLPKRERERVTLGMAWSTLWPRRPEIPNYLI